MQWMWCCTGCEECYCDSVGSYNRSCDVGSGQCYCKRGVIGLKCDQCMPHYYGFTDTGCTGILSSYEMCKVRTSMQYHLKSDFNQLFTLSQHCLKSHHALSSAVDSACMLTPCLTDVSSIIIVRIACLQTCGSKTFNQSGYTVMSLPSLSTYNPSAVGYV